jgi:hypothetical protein
MNVIEEIKGRLEKYPHANFETGDHYVRILPLSEDGFTVELIIENGGCTVHFNGWHERFDTIEEGLNCFALGLCTDCRLRVHYRWGFAYKWTVEYKEGDEWVEDCTTGLLIYPYFGKKRIRYLQNRLIEAKERLTKTDVQQTDKA